MGELISKREKKKIFQKQEDQYQFPYHHTPHFLEDGCATRVRHLDWGFDYLACLHYVRECVENHKPQSVLEVGCGDGAIIGSLDQNIPKRVGVDLSEKAIAFATAFFPDIIFRSVDAKLLADTFDAVIAVEVLEHIPDEQVIDFLKTLEERTKKGGLIYISVPSVNLPLYEKHYRHYDPSLLAKQINASGLDVDIIELRFFRSPVLFENFYKRLTNNRFWLGEFHPIRRKIWNNIVKGLNSANPKTAQHVVAILKKR